MSGPINTIPAGFLDLLGLKVQGVNPVVAGEAVQPTLDMIQFYLAQKKTIIRCLIANVGVDTPAFQFFPITNTFTENLAVGGQLIVPQGEVWWLEWFETWVLFDTVAGQAGTIVPAFQVPGHAITAPTLGHGTTASSATIGNARSQGIANPVFVMPGTEIGAVVAQGLLVTTGSLVLTGRMMLARFRI